MEEDSIVVNILESTTLDIGIGGSGSKTVAVLEDVEGSSSAWVDEDDVEITGVFWVKQGLYPGTAALDPYVSVKKTSSWRASTHHGVQQGRQCAGQLTIVRHGAYLEYTQNIMLQHQGEDPTGKPDTPYPQH
ncbi:hypothetical protein TNCV_1090341 [Trichonephila clavipes]|uniref:Uncharacterized protein n=1 Tax=Trichonephila clavipes TaxID=2585209 RepID=A0A8X6ST48_TRICX|nr:hypothetical protein TNCV_1090341 [Trichonephila clavipes]